MFQDGVRHHAAVFSSQKHFLPTARFPTAALSTIRIMFGREKFLDILETLVDPYLFESDDILTMCRIIQRPPWRSLQTQIESFRFMSQSTHNAHAYEWYLTLIFVLMFSVLFYIYYLYIYQYICMIQSSLSINSPLSSSPCANRIGYNVK